MLVSAYRNGSTAGSPPPARDHSEDAKRGLVKGWSRDAVRRHTKWLYSVDSGALTGEGYSCTLTIRDLPPTAEDWTRLRSNWLYRLRRRGATRIHWVTEWQRRGVPHMHCAIYFPEGTGDMEGLAMPVVDWLRVSQDYGSRWASQDGKRIDGPLGWLQYLSKHAARGVAHYQRAGSPPGWEKTGRLWGHWGSWPVDEPMQFDMPAAAYWRYRRLVRSWTVAGARSSGSASSIRYARGMLRCHDRALSSVRGVSQWLPEDLTLQLVALLDSEGYPVIQRVGDVAGSTPNP